MNNKIITACAVALVCLFSINPANAQEENAAYNATLKAASDKEPDEVAHIRTYYTQISKRAKNRKNLLTRTDSVNNTLSILEDKGQMVFITHQSPPKATTQTYTEFLFDQQTKLVFAYETSGYKDERGKLNSQLRCYWHNGVLIHSKIKGDLITVCDDLLKEANHLRDFADL